MLLLFFFISCHLKLVVSLSSLCRRNESIDIHIIGFFPCTHPNDTRGIPVDNCDGIERIPIMKLALEEINERCDLLPGYRLVVDYANSACLSIAATYHLIQQTDSSQPTKLMILGPACSEPTIIMGEIAERFLHIPQVSYSASASLFAINKRRYPRFYRLISIAEQFANENVEIMKELGWKRVAMISYSDELLIHLAQYNAQKLRENDVHVILNEIFANDDPHIVIEQVKKVNARIIIVWLPQTPVVITLHFWCMVIKSQLTGPDFVWILPGWYVPGWWNDVRDTDCTATEMKVALEHSLTYASNSVVDTNLSRVIVSGKNVSQFQSDLAAIENAFGTVRTDTILDIGYVYDAVWTIALALNSSISILEERGLGRLEDFTYGPDSLEMADVLTETIANISFEGISGLTTFEDNGNRVGYSIQVQQYRGGERISVVIYDSVEGFHHLPGQDYIWKGGYLPRDAPVPVILKSTLAERIIAGVAASVGILSSIFFFVFNTFYNKHPVVKRSSYRLNSLILVGVFVGFVGTLLHVIRLDSDMSETFTTTVCNARVWTNELAFVVAFGTLFVKIWRLYKVFFNTKLVYRKYLDDRYLFMMVAAIVAPTLVILIVQVSAFPLTLRTVATVNENDFSVEEIYSECKGTHEFLFSAFAYTEDGILALFSVLVAYQTRKRAPKFDRYRKYHESAVVNLTTILAILLSSVCQALLIIFRLNRIQEGVLLVVTLRDCLWMYPMIYLLFVPKVYRICCRSYSSRINLLHQFSAIINTTHHSLSSLPGRRHSVSSVLSFSERRGSFQSRKRESDSSLRSIDKSNRGNDRKLSITNMVKSEVMFSPIHEHSEELSEIPQHNGLSFTICLDPTTEIMNFSEEPKAISRITHLKCTEV